MNQKKHTHKIKDQEVPDYLFFWGHRPGRNGIITKSCLSQWWSCRFMEDDIMYRTAEHYMMAAKAKLFGDMEIFEKIMTKESPKDAKDLGRQVKNYENDLWDAKKYEIVKQGNFLKFSQNHELRDFLLQTKHKVLVEASPVDIIWGIGLTEDDPKAKCAEEWRGQNLLGFVQHQYALDFNTLDELVRTSDKQRFAFNDDLTKIRANQGHSISVDLELQPIQPPEFLYHGTVSQFMDSIQEKGLQKQKRLHVHLSSDRETAIKVAGRRGKPIVLKVLTSKMYEDGYSFYLSENKVWLCDEVPFAYILLENQNG